MAKISLDVATEVATATKAMSPALKRLLKSLPKLDPKSMPIGALADTLYDLRQLSKVLGSITAPFNDVIAPAIKLVEDHFIMTLTVGESSGVQGKKSRVQVTILVVPVPDDWPKFYAYIARTKSFDLLNRAVNRLAVQERWDNHKQIPGMGKFTVKKVSCTKLSR